jgi:subtilisin-like proprotein convertase family protein
LVCTAAPPGDYIQYFRVFDIANDAMLSSIDLGVEFTDGISPYTVEVWDITGQTISLATIAAAPQLLNVDVVTGAPIFRQIVNLPLPTTVLPGGSTIAISIGATGTANGQPGSAVGFDLTGETGPTYVNGCLNTAGVPAFIVDEISDLNLFSTRGLILALNLDLPNIIVTQTDGSGLTSGDLFPIGTTTQTWIHTDASGNADTCSFNITVEEFANPITDLACNDLVHLSPDQDCEILVTADMILEGGPYGCYDDYIVDLFYDIDMTQPVPTSPVATGAEVGLTLVVSVTDPTTGNSCWGYALVEDKLIPALECSAYEVDCDDDITAGTYPSGSVNSVTSLTPGTFITVGAPGVVEFPLALQGSFSSVTDVNVSFDVSHTWVADVTVKVTSPSGTSVQVLNSECGSFDDFVLSFDDAFPAPYSDIGANCSATPPAMSGEYKPANALSAFNGEEANGVWTVTFTDGVGGDDGTVNAITLEVSATTTSGIPLPLPEDAVATPASGTGPFVVSGFDPCGDVTLTYVDNVIDIDCTVADEPLTALVLRNWTAVDGYGNVTTCTDSISLRKADLATLALPVDRDDVDAPALSCNGGWDWNNDGIPQPAELGDDISAVCDLEVFWTDRIFYDACKTKILRDWVIVDDCTGEVLEHTQLIVIKNDVPPTIYCVEEMEVSTDHNSCSVDVNVPTPTIDFGCLTITDPCAYYTVTASAGTVVNYGGCAWKVLDMPVGVHTITYTVNDGCGNEAYCETTISVRDDVPPIPICDVNTRVSLGSDGVALIPASTFNDGSYDNCGPITIKVRRKYFGDCVPALSNNDRQWKDAEEFCCADIDDNPILVELGVWDASGNFNSCWVSVEVEDKLPPYIEAPEDITISCDFKFDLNNLSIFGGIAFDQSTRGYIVLDDVDYYDCLYGPDYSGPRPAINWGKEGYAADNCDVVIYENENIDMVCGRSKIVNGVYRPAITRVFTAEDPNGLTASDVQRIYIIDCDPFTILDTDTRCRDRGLFYTNKDDVEWPCDVELDGCAGADLSPDNTGRPIYTDDKCSIVADTFYDEVFTVVPDACFKILRHWSILDWCQYDPVTGYGRWDYTQVIKVNDEEAPVVIPSQPGCVDSIPDQGCTAYTDLRPNVDDCTPIDHMIVWWRIDAFNDGLGSLPGGYDFEGTNPDPSGFYPYGVHKILWVVEDMCGNKTTAEYTFEVVDCKKPSPVCINGLSSVVMPSSGEICVWAVDFDASSFDNCDSDLDYRIWYDGMDSTYYPDQTRDWRRPVAGDSGDDVLYYLPSSACFTCEGIGNGISGTFEVYVYVVDNYGNWDYCTTYIIIDDNDDVCPDNGSSIIAGGIENELGEVVDETMVTLQGGAGAQINRQQMNDNDGEFQFYVSPGYNWEVTSDRSDSYLNGVTAQDLSLIQRHIAGIEYLSSNYKLVAADADANMDIDIRDVLDLRKLLLGVYDELPANKSWRVLDADYTFPGITNRSLPAGIYDMENINLIDVTTDVMDVDFVGVKVGDVDNDALPNSLVAGQGRDEGALTFAASEVSFAAGEEVSVAITAENFNAMTAYQFSLRYDNSVLDFTGVEAGALNVTNDNFGTRFANRGVLTSVWYSANAVNASADEVLYTMTFKAKSSGQLSTSLSIASVVTEAMAFGNESGRTDIELTFTTETGEIVGDAYALFQNTPNPFASHTVIGFVLPEAANATLTVYDVNGKVITRADVDGVKGYNEVSMTRSQINATGVLYYQVETDGFSATKKMVVVE